MRIGIFLIIMLIVKLLYGQNFSFDSVMTISYKNQTIPSVLRNLENKIPYKFSYSNDVFRPKKKITIEQSITFSSLLEKMLEYHKLDYQLMGNQIVIFQNKTEKEEGFTLNGYINEAQTKETLIGATIYFPELNIGTSSNSYGFYSITIPTGSYLIEISYIGYETIRKKVEAKASLRINWHLDHENTEIDEIVISEKHTPDIHYSLENDFIKLNRKSFKNIPVVFGEEDVIKTLHNMPGIQTISEGMAGIFVRGGRSDQNLYLVDEAPIFNSSHMAGLFSIFNPDAIKSVNFYKSGIPSKYGNRVSSVLDIKLKEGDMENYHLSGGIGFISSRFTLEGPIKKGKASFIISARRTYLDMLLKLSKNPVVNKNQIFFYDLNPKFNIQINNNNRLYISGYFGRDKYSYDDLFGLSWGNYSGTVRWNRIIDEKMFMNATFITSDYRYNFDVEAIGNGFVWNSDIQAYHIKLDFTRYISTKLKVDFGLNNVYHYFYPAEISPKDSTSFLKEFVIDHHKSFTNNAYLHFYYSFNERFSMEAGTRINAYQNLGPGEKYIYNGKPSNSEIIDTVFYKSDDIMFYHFGLEPRISFVYNLNKSSGFKFNYNRTLQYIQSLSYSGGNYPGERWIPATGYVKPLIANQLSLRYHKQLEKSNADINIELYSKWIKNQIDTKNNSEISFSNNIESQLYSGKGYSYGLELLMIKDIGKMTGQIGYTLSKTLLKIPEFNNGKPYSPYFDKRHNLTTTISFKWRDRLIPSFVFNLASGRAISLPVGKYELNNTVIPLFDENNYNGDRMPTYHRLDFSLDILPSKKKNKKWKSYWNISIYNVYLRKNPVTIIYKEVINNDPSIDVNDPQVEVESRNYKPVNVSFYQFVPSVTYNFKF